MLYEEFASKYHNLIYAPLDIKLPNLDLNKLIDYSLKHRKELIYDPYCYAMTRYKPKVTKVDVDSYLASSQQSFWETYYPLLEGKWLANFDTEFPELIKLFNDLPMPNFGTLGYLYQNNNFDCESGPIHFDQKKGLGIRITFSSDTHGLFFHKPIHPLDSDQPENLMIKRKVDEINILDDYGDALIKNGSYVINEEILHPKRIYATQTNTTAQAFILTNELAPHAVLKRKNPSITFAVFGKKDHKERFYWDQLDKILTTTQEKFPNSFIWL